MSTFIRCPKCRKLNPISPAEAVNEHTCVFCGAIIPSQTTAKHENEATHREPRRFPLSQSEAKPVNKNQRKPMF